MPIVMKGGPGQSRGFTLVEMSIVLVIIGLIIGGILKGQEIIASARSKAVVNQVNAVRAAANTYFDRYRALPGDDSTGHSVDTNIGNGDGNGIVDDGAGGGTAANNAAFKTLDGSAVENYQFFNALIATNLLNGGQVTSGTSGGSFGHTALPAAPISGAGMTVVYGTMSATGSTTTQVKTGHWIRVHKSTTANNAAMSPRTLANIDTQIDDGVGDNGSVRGYVGADGGTATNCVNGAYAKGDDVTCIGIFEQ